MVGGTLLFPGQGSQYVGMGKDLYRKYELAKEIFHEASEAMNMDLTKLMFEGSMEELTRTEYAQPAILTVGMAMYKIYRDLLGKAPQFLAGHSLGEITALTCAGGIPFDSAVRIVHRRGELMRDADDAGSGAMAAVMSLSAAEVAEICKHASSSFQGGAEIVVVSNINSDDQVVISGHKGVLNEVVQRISKRGGVVIPLHVSAPFHSPLMAPAAQLFAEELKGLKLGTLQHPVVSSVTARLYRSVDEIPAVLTEQITAPVQWTAVIRFLLENGVSEAVEMGPQSILKKLANNSTALRVLSFDHEPDREQLLEKGRDEGQDYSLDFIIQCLTIVTCMRNRNRDLEQYEQGVVAPYREVQTMLNELQLSRGRAEWKDLVKAYEMLISAFHTKLVPENEQQDRLEQVLHDNGLKDKLGSRFLASNRS